MKLIELSIDSFRGINGEGNKILLNDSDIIFLFGQNDIVKSSFLDAYEYFVMAKKKAAIEDFYNQDPTNKIKMQAEGVIDEPRGHGGYSFRSSVV
ncbi:MAG: hypothetical protein JEY79_13500 [Pseudodesulfovibrio sp.]|nr:hypothetical protein [Pseudodesulfovibrio sp.]